MTLQSLPGQFSSILGPNPLTAINTTPNTGGSITIDAANEASHFLGEMVWADGASHTIDTTGSSLISWRTAAVTFANAGTTLKVGIADVDTTTGPPGRAVNVADVITLDVAAVFTGGGAGVTANAWQNSTPTTGTKTIADGALIAMCVQATARAGADSIIVSAGPQSTSTHFPSVTEFTGGAYATDAMVPLVMFTASDGTLGWLFGCDNQSTASTRAYSSGSSPSEFGQLYQLPYPYKIFGAYGWVAPAADFTINVYSDPLGTPVSQRSRAIDANTVSIATGRRFMNRFTSAYSVAANAPVGVILTPGASNITAYFKTLNSATYRIADPWGTSGYGISRSGGAGAFANANSSLDHYFIGLLISAYADDAFNGFPGSRVRTGM